MRRWSVNLIGKEWVATLYRPGFGWACGYATCLQDAYAWLFRRIDAIAPPPNRYDNHPISGAKEEA